MWTPLWKGVSYPHLNAPSHFPIHLPKAQHLALWLAFHSINARKQAQRTQGVKVQRTGEAHLIRKLHGDVPEELEVQGTIQYCTTRKSKVLTSETEPRMNGGIERWGAWQWWRPHLWKRVLQNSEKLLYLSVYYKQAPNLIIINVEQFSSKMKNETRESGMAVYIFSPSTSIPALERQRLDYMWDPI